VSGDKRIVVGDVSSTIKLALPSRSPELRGHTSARGGDERLVMEHFFEKEPRLLRQGSFFYVV
jgi:hypothetical protein